VHGHARVPLIFAVRQRNMDKAEQMLLEISDPTHPRWGQQLSLEEVNALTADYAAAREVVSWLLQNGISREHIVVTPNHGFVHVCFNLLFTSSFSFCLLWCPLMCVVCCVLCVVCMQVSMTSSEAEELLDAEFYHWHHPSVGTRSHVQAESYALPTRIDELCDFVTASSVYPNAHPRTAKRAMGPSDGWPADAPFPPPGWVVPQVIWRVYGIQTPTVSNTQSTQSVYENLAQSYAPSDLAQFQSAFNIAVNPIANVVCALMRFAVLCCGGVALCCAVLAWRCADPPLLCWWCGGV
jgi:hypothetical protein